MKKECKRFKNIKYAISMTFPIFLQFLSICYKWFRLEKRENKRWSWILLILQFWPQWRALRIINLSYKKDEKAERKKQELLREIMCSEPFLEAWPSIMIMTMIWVPLLDSVTLTPPQEYCKSDPANNHCAVFSGPGGATWFFITFGISVVTGALGITKFLQTGPFSVISEEGPLGGILRWKFIFAFQAVMWSILAKGVFMALMMGDFWSPTFQKEIFGASSPFSFRISMMMLLTGTVILPNLLWGFISMALATGINKKLFQVIINYPASVVLPIATFFTIGSLNSKCCIQTQKRQRHLGFSKWSSIMNMVLTLLMYLILLPYFAKYSHPGLSELFTMIFPPVILLCLVFNIIYLTLDQPCCCSGSQKCYFDGCCGPSCFIRKEQIIDLENNEIEIIQIKLHSIVVLLY